MGSADREIPNSVPNSLEAGKLWRHSTPDCEDWIQLVSTSFATHYNTLTKTDIFNRHRSKVAAERSSSLGDGLFKLVTTRFRSRTRSDRVVVYTKYGGKHKKESLAQRKVCDEMDRGYHYQQSNQGYNGYSSERNLPYKSYTRKNIGYLYAIEHGAEWIYDTDDDNKPYGSCTPTKEVALMKNSTKSLLQFYLRQLQSEVKVEEEASETSGMQKLRTSTLEK
ncbi:hypothetical protein TELCIR_09431 [Teladorsagia circumcincta]|uniref:Uncharacterized protein n=1 Tax=Teladorsagia circumcincta TaxID=45464 RepID=A0A2G9UEU3_TELCI|nr:hypothetical protein TELCIR_09431 [Teladorsagia circumcincta]